MEDGLSDDDVNTIGFGAGGSVTVNTDPVVPSVGVSYNYSHDDGETGDYHLIKVGTNVGLVLHPRFVVTPYAIWTSDQTDYEEGDADDYFDTGVEMAYRLDTGWQFSLGYKKVVDLDNFDSDQVYLGALWKF
jgi:hypothetical protein